MRSIAITRRRCGQRARHSSASVSETSQQGDYMDFAERYGPWAVIAGASEGTGRAFSRQVAAKGLNCLLIARREAPLAELAGQIRSEHGVECLTASRSEERSV